MEGIRDFKGILGEINYGKYDPKYVFSRQGQTEVFLTRCLEGGKAERLTDWIEPN